eukprot:CAMPEP_0184859564 /NCGR_PEP_ID=MMETSP0580-20130426/4547_1 /TAXON_ID=1118495 /ORGANISM="Dactyliosolen fragilissimus" /LENGTH=500 /DNA_ID=CAMNT_0027356265 /DNA_START=173 /DNA_END=1672 /DNA_ORIENTATION=-
MDNNHNNDVENITIQTTMEERPFDIMVYGATGYTGKRVARYISESYPSIRLALAGRSREGLVKVASELGLFSSCIFVATATKINDSKDKDDGKHNVKDGVDNSMDEEEGIKNSVQNLSSVLSKTRLVLACAGPYRQMGEAVVKASILAKTDYLDLCGEPQFFDDMLVKYEEEARIQNVLVVSACAFDCVPAELSYALASKALLDKYGRDNAGGEEDVQVCDVEIVHTFQNIHCANATTYHAAIDGFHAAATGDLKKSRNAVATAFGKHIIQTPKQRPNYWPKDILKPPKILPEFHPHTNTYTLKFVGADASCILASERYKRIRLNHNEQNIDTKNPNNTNKPSPKLSVCFGVPTKMDAYKILAYGGVFSTLARNSWGCNLLHNHPEFFTNHMFQRKGPTEEQLRDGSFVTHAIAYGVRQSSSSSSSNSNDSNTNTNTSNLLSVRTTCSGPEPGYVATPKIIVALALMVLKDRHTLPYTGGVMLPGVLFGNTPKVYQYLQK